MYVVGRPHADVQAGRISSLNKLPGLRPRLFPSNRAPPERAIVGGDSEDVGRAR
jgi:hypothetical protein